MCRETLASGRDGDGQVPKGAYTRDEVSMHDTMEDAWLIYEDKVSFGAKYERIFVVFASIMVDSGV